MIHQLVKSTQSWRFNHNQDIGILPQATQIMNSQLDQTNEKKIIPVLMKTILVSNSIRFFYLTRFFVTFLSSCALILRLIFYASKKQFWKCHETYFCPLSTWNLDSIFICIRRLRRFSNKSFSSPPFEERFLCSSFNSSKNERGKNENVKSKMFILGADNYWN